MTRPAHWDFGHFDTGRTDDDGNPVKTATYTVRFTMNEEHFGRTHDEHVEAFTQEIQDALDHTPFTIDLRYDAIEFTVEREEHA